MTLYFMVLFGAWSCTCPSNYGTQLIPAGATEIHSNFNFSMGCGCQTQPGEQNIEFTIRWSVAEQKLQNGYRVFSVKPSPWRIEEITRKPKPQEFTTEREPITLESGAKP